jgi:hypothetical protein
VRTPNNKTTAAQALAVFEDKPYCVFRNGDDDGMNMTVHDGQGWGPGELLGGSTSHAPAVASFQSWLHSVYRDADNARMWSTMLA